MGVASALPHDTLLPRPPGGNGPGAALALLAHLGLLLALTQVVDWRATAPEVVSAELWAAVPQAAAPPAPEAPSPPAAEPTLQVIAPEPAPQRRAEPAPSPPPAREADIAIERERKLQAERQRAEEQAAAEARRQRDELARKQAEKKAEKQAELDRRKADEKKRAEAEKKLADKKRAEQDRLQREAEAREAKAEEARLTQQREANLRRMMGQATGTGAPDSSGTAARAAGPSASYSGKLIAAIRRNIVFTGSLNGNPVATVEVTAAPGGSIISRRLIKSSGHRGWDEAVLRAVERTATLPRDTDGRVPSPLTIDFRYVDQ